MSNNAASILSLLIKVAKEGDADEKLITNLEKLKKGAEGAGEEMRSFRLYTGEAAKASAILKESTGRSLVQFLQLRGVSGELIQSLQGLQFAAKSAAGGFTLVTSLTLGAAAAATLLIGKMKALSAELEAASQDEIQSAKDLNFVLENKAKVLERIASKRRADAQLSAFDFLVSSREKDTERSILELQKHDIRQSGQSALREFSLQRQGLGADRFKQADVERALAFVRINEKQRALNAEIDREFTLREKLGSALKEQQEALDNIKDATHEEFNERKRQVEETSKALNEQNKKFELLLEKREALEAVSAEEVRLLNEKNQKEKKDAALDAEEKLLSIKEQFQSAIEDQFALEAKMKGITDDRVAKAYAVLSAQNQTTEAARLMTLELAKQKDKLGEISTLTRTSREIANLGGLNIEALASRGSTLSERSRIRNLAGDFQRDFAAEQTRLRRSGIRDEGIIRQKLASFAENRITPGSDLAGILGITKTEKADKARDKEIDKLVQTADIAQSREAITRLLAELAKHEESFVKEFSSYVIKRDKQFEDLRLRLKK